MIEQLKGLIERVERLLLQLEQQLPPVPTPTDWTALAYRWHRHPHGGVLQAIPHPHTLQLDDLQGINRQRSMLA